MSYSNDQEEKGFQEAVILPFSTFQKCKFDEADNDSTKAKTILDSNLKTPIKMKLFEHERLLEKRKRELLPYSPVDKKTNEDGLTNDISVKFRPYVKSILEFMKSHPDEIGFNEKYEIRINQEFIPNSNLSDIFKYLMKSGVITKEEDIPDGTYRFLDKLYDLGMPKSWIRIKVPTRKSTRLTRELQYQQQEWDKW